MHLIKNPGRRSVGTNLKNCLLLYGPPGTGKSTIAQVLFRTCDPEIEIVYADGGSFRTAYQGSGREKIDALFAEAKKKAAASKKKRVYILVDEIDGATSKLEGNNHTQEDNRALKTLLTTLDKHRHDDTIFMIFTANYIEKIDPAFIRRCTCIEVAVPTYEIRKQIIEYYLKKNKIEVKAEGDNCISPEFFDTFLSATEGMSGDALEVIINNAVMQAELGLKPEKEISAGFRLNAIDIKNKSLSNTIKAALEAPLTPLYSWCNAYTNTALDKHIYAQFNEKVKTQADIEKREKANDPANKKRSISDRAKEYAQKGFDSIMHGIFVGFGGDVYNLGVSKLAPRWWPARQQTAQAAAVANAAQAAAAANAAEGA